jgi:hypothetical protein
MNILLFICNSSTNLLIFCYITKDFIPIPVIQRTLLCNHLPMGSIFDFVPPSCLLPPWLVLQKYTIEKNMVVRKIDIGCATWTYTQPCVRKTTCEHNLCIHPCHVALSTFETIGQCVPEIVALPYVWTLSIAKELLAHLCSMVCKSCTWFDVQWWTLHSTNTSKFAIIFRILLLSKHIIPTVFLLLLIGNVHCAGPSLSPSIYLLKIFWICCAYVSIRSCSPRNWVKVNLLWAFEQPFIVNA